MNKSRPLACVALLLGAVALAAEEAAEPAPPPAFVVRPPSDFQRMLERPLFNANRKAEDSTQDDTVSSADEQQLRENWRLTGVLIEPQRQLALFSQLKGGSSLQLESGAVLDNNWVLEQIAADHVVLQRSGLRIEILLYDPAAQPVAAPQAPQVAPPAAKPKPIKSQDAAQPKVPAVPG